MKYEIQKQLNEILNISGYSLTDEELFDMSDYPNDGKVGGWMQGKKHSEATKRKMSKAKMGNKNPLGHKQTEEHRKNKGLSQKKARANRFWSTKKK